MKENKSVANETKIDLISRIESLSDKLDDFAKTEIDPSSVQKWNSAFEKSLANETEV